MITQDEAASIAERVVGTSADDPDRGWTLEEFEAGWLIDEKATAGLMGAGSRVVEKASGRVMHFPSSVPPGRIVEEYAKVLKRGLQEYPSALSRELADGAGEATPFGGGDLQRETVALLSIANQDGARGPVAGDFHAIAAVT